jgi:two-component system response regulator AtoC
LIINSLASKTGLPYPAKPGEQLAPRFKGMTAIISSSLDRLVDDSFVYGRSQKIENLNVIVGQIARTDIAVLVVGESGTGKEAYARLIHRLSGQSNRPLKKLSCSALAPEQLLPQLDAHLQTSIKDIAESQGTLFLDRIDELDLTSQKVLLSLLPEGGAGEVNEKRFRLISSTSQNLEPGLELGTFRRELFYRISGVSLHLPPLRQRKEDIPVFLEYFLARLAPGLTQQAPVLSCEELEILTAYEWPGNIRELRNFARKMVALGSAKTAIADLGITERAMAKVPISPKTSSLKAAARAASRQVERQLILKALERTHWNRKRAAQELQISYKSLLYKIKQTGVEETKAREP